MSLTLHSFSYLFYLISGRTLIFIFRGTGSSVVCLVRCLALLLIVSLALLGVGRLTALSVVGGTFLTEGSFQFLSFKTTWWTIWFPNFVRTSLN